MTSPSGAPVDHSAYVPQLTGIRAVAAWLVYLHHLWFAQGTAAVAALPAAVIAFNREMHIGVNLFFVLSGFLIYRRYAYTCDGSPAWWRRYMHNRVARIYPMYFLLTIVTFVVMRQTSFRVWFMNLTFLRGFSSHFLFSGIAQGWSLTVEECFYVLAPILFLTFRKRGWFWTPLLLIYAAGGLLLALGTVVHKGGFFDNAHVVIECTFFGRAFEFFIGMVVARVTEVRRDERKHGVVTWLSVIAVGGTAMLLTRFQAGPHPAVESGTVGIIANNFVVPCFFALLLYGLLTERSLLRWALATPAMDLFGRASYTFYLIHMGVIRDLIDRSIATGPAAAQIAVAFVAMNACALVLFLTVEEPLNRAIRKVRFGKAPAAVAVRSSEA